MFQQLTEIRTATLAARQRKGDAAISTRAEAGQIQIVRVVMLPNGDSVVTPFSGWMPVADVVGALAAI
jgi:hypothetical protein